MLLHYIVHLPNIEDDISDNTKYIRDEYARHNEVHVKCVVCAFIYQIFMLLNRELTHCPTVNIHTTLYKIFS